MNYPSKKFLFFGRILGICSVGLWVLILSSHPATASAASKTGFRIGLDVASEGSFSFLKGRTVGLIAHRASVNRKGQHILFLLKRHRDIHIKALFAPRYGLHGQQEKPFGNSRDKATGLPIFSLDDGSAVFRDEEMTGIDVLVYDLQPIGTPHDGHRTIIYEALHAAARNGIPLVVFDRPPLLGAGYVAGGLPIDEEEACGYGRCHVSLPYICGLTPGEMALLMNEEKEIGASLYVVPMSSHDRSAPKKVYWKGPARSLQTPDRVLLHVGPGIILSRAGLHFSKRRSLYAYGAPWIESPSHVAELLDRQGGLPGLRYQPARFTCGTNVCRGLALRIVDRDAYDPLKSGLTILQTLYDLYPEHIDLSSAASSLGDWSLASSIRSFEDPEKIVSDWQETIFLQFLALREKYLLYVNPARRDEKH